MVELDCAFAASVPRRAPSGRIAARAGQSNLQKTYLRVKVLLQPFADGVWYGEVLRAVVGLKWFSSFEHDRGHGLQLLILGREVVRSGLPHPLQKVAGTGCLIQKSAPEFVPRFAAPCRIKVGKITGGDGVLVLGAIGDACSGVVCGADVGVVPEPVELAFVCEAEPSLVMKEDMEVCSSVSVSLSSDEYKDWLRSTEAGDEGEEIFFGCVIVIGLRICQEEIATLPTKSHFTQLRGFA